MIRVSVICLCYNHAPFLKEALESVILQTYPNIELIIVDDCSQDQSAALIQEFIQSIPHYGLGREIPITLIRNEKNLGNCQSFNLALKEAKGDLIIDFATDDLMLDHRIERQVEAFDALDKSYGVLFSNAVHISEKGQVRGYHYPVGKEGKAHGVPTGHVYTEVLKRYFICTPTMMIRKAVLDEIGGYDESLSYEDFDFWVRTAKKYKYYFLNEVNTQKRDVGNSLSKKFYDRKNNMHLLSTLRVCEKAQSQNTLPEETKALAGTLRYYIRQCVYTHQFDLAFRFRELLVKTEKLDRVTRFFLWMASNKIRIGYLYRIYLWLRNRN